MAYVGPLTPEEAAAGIQAAGRNARSLVRDAELLLANGRWARASSLAILAIEEAAKRGVLRTILLATTTADLKREWRAYRQHTSKNFMAAYLEHARPGALLEDFRPLFTDTPRHRDTDLLKQQGFYSDHDGRGSWIVPEEVVDEDVARALVITAKLAAGKEDGAMTTAAELRLWVKHLRPVWRTTLAAMKDAVAACYREAVATGVLQGAAKPVRMADFLGLATDGTPDPTANGP